MSTIDLEAERLRRMEKLEVRVRCVACGHEWPAILPVPIPHHIECEECEYPKRKARESVLGRYTDLDDQYE